MLVCKFYHLLVTDHGDEDDDGGGAGDDDNAVFDNYIKYGKHYISFTYPYIHDRAFFWLCRCADRIFVRLNER